MAYQHPYVKQVNRCATVAFAPNAPFIATGTMAGAIDLSFSTTACLEVRNSTVPRLAHLRFFPSVRRPDRASSHPSLELTMAAFAHVDLQTGLL